MSSPDSSERQQTFLAWLDQQELPRSSLYECPYLPNRKALQYGFASETLDADLYEALMDRGFRRSGQIFYSMDCPDCQACMTMRIPVATFRASKSQRRTARKNQDVRVEFATPQFRTDSYELYRRYLRHQHPDTPQDESEASFRDMLYREVVDSLEARYFLGERLIGVSLLDITPQSLSAVYHFFEPELRERRIGVFSVLAEIEHTRELQIPHYYLGYWVKNAKTMHYKADYGPNEVLVSGNWSADYANQDDQVSGNP
ncbi:MAG: arginyl-tRNA--protein-N-Asp/Glu arginylyltransferase [Planctomycetota bacterium]|jgi:arginyl-tRNA--protein-N-Asp/Glu arginylyltransferase